MSSMKKSAKKVMTRGRDATARVGKVTKSAVVAGAKAGTAAAITAGALEAKKSWKATSPAAKLRTRKGMAALVAGAVVLSAAGVVIANSRRKK